MAGLGAAAPGPGDLLEIGAYHGKSSILLGYLAGNEDELVVCDPFDSATTDDMLEGGREQRRWYADAARDKFEANFLRFHSALPNIIAETSTALDDRLAERRFRIIHIDGSHQYEDVKHDLELSQGSLLPNGVVVIDDIRTEHTPGVAAVAWEFVANRGLVPAIYTSKLYASWSVTSAEALRKMARRDQRLSVVEHFVGQHVVLEVAIPQRRSRLANSLAGLTPPILVPTLLALRRRLVAVRS